MEALETRRVLAVNVFIDAVTGNVTIKDDDTAFAVSNTVQEDNNVTLSNGVMTPGRLRIVDPGGAILDPAIPAVTAAQINATTVEINATEVLDIDLQGGDDEVIVAADFDSVATVTTLNLHGGDNAGGDVLNIEGAGATIEDVVISPNSSDPTTQNIIGLAAQIDVSGIELITYVGADADDTLSVDLGLGDDTARIRNATSNRDVVESSSLPNIEFTDLDTFTLIATGSGNNVGTFVIRNLLGAQTYESDLTSFDTLVIEGRDGNDDLFTVTNPAAASVAVMDSAGVTVTNLSQVGRLQINALGGDDTVTVDVDGTELIEIPISYDGGGGNDVLNVIGNATGGVTNVEYTPGSGISEGRLTYDATMTIDFAGLEPVNDNLAATNLVVNGTNADNAISYSDGDGGGVFPAGTNTGLVSVDGFETIEFASKTTLTVNGLAGDDSIDLKHTAAAVPTDLTFIVANGGLGRDLIDGSNNTTATPLMLFGGDDDDTLIGGFSGDLLLGGIGNDTLVDSGGDDYFEGGHNGQIPGTIPVTFPVIPPGLALPPAVIDPLTATSGFDSVVVRGTGVNDILSVTQDAPSMVAGSGYPLSVINSAGGLVIPAATADVLGTFFPLAMPDTGRPSIEEVRIEAGAGNDQIAVAHADQYSDDDATNGIPQQMVRFDVRGTAPDASDRLVVQDLGPGDLILHRQSASERTGRITVAPAVNTTTMPGFSGDIVYSGIENVDVTPLSPFTGGTGNDGEGRLVVFQADPFEANDALPVATDSGDLTTIHRDPSIDPGNFASFFGPNADEDWYVFHATGAGTAQVDLLYNAIAMLGNGRMGLPGNGDLVVGVYDPEGNLIAAGGGLTDAAGMAIGASVSFGTVPNARYYIRVTGAPLTVAPAASESAAINTYDLRIIENIDSSGGGGAGRGLGPQIIDPDGPDLPAQAIQIVDNPFYDLFSSQTDDGKQAPTPPIHGLTINFRDPITRTQVGTSPGATLGALDPASALSPAHYSLVGDATGPVPITEVSFAHPSTTPSVAGTLAMDGTTSRFVIGAGLNLLGNANALRIVGQTIQWTGGTNVGLTARITAYDNATGLARVATPFPNAAMAGDTFIILPSPNVVSPVTLLQGVTVAPGYAAGANNGGGSFSGAVNIAANPPAAYIGQSVQLTNSSTNPGFTATVPQQRTIVGVTGGGAFVFNQPFTGNVPAGTTFNIVGTAATDQGVVVAGVNTALTFAGGATPMNNFGNGSMAGDPLSVVNGFYAGQALTFTDGPLAGQSRVILAYDAAGPTFTFSHPFTAAPRDGDHFLIGPAVAPPLQGGGVLAGTTETMIIGTTAFVPNAGASMGGLSTTPGDYVGQLLTITAGPLNGQSQLIIAYDGAGTLSVQDPFTAVPGVGTTFVIQPINQAAVTLSFDGPLPDDRYTLTVSDLVRDYSGNRLDGENNGVFPSGDGFSGGSFVTNKFSVDTTAELGVWAGGSVYLDANGNFVFDPNNPDAGNRDIVHTLGFTTDFIFAGNFAEPPPPATTADGFDKLAAYGRVGVGSTATFRWLIDFSNDGVPDETFTEPAGYVGTGIPVAGNFDGNALNGDEVGRFTGNSWIFDGTSGAKNYLLSDEAAVASDMRGLPFVGDFDGDGLDDLGTYDSINNIFQLSLTDGPVPDGGPTNPQITDSFRIDFGFPFIGVRSRPVAGDINGDGVDDIGLWVPDRSGILPREAAEWYFLVSGAETLSERLMPPPPGSPPGTLATINYTPAPFGPDRFAQFGDEFAIPLLGNFDPPPSGTAPVADPGTTGTNTGPATPPVEDNSPPPVNPSPEVVASLGRMTVQEDTAIGDINLNEVFSDNDPLVFSVLLNSNPDLVVGSIQDSMLRLQTAQNASGTAELVIEARDAAENVTRDSLVLNVVPTNDSPIAVGPAPMVTMHEDQPIQEIDLGVWFLDPDQDALGFEVVGQSNSSVLANVKVDGSILSLAPAADASGYDELVIRAVDAGGRSATTPLRIHVLPVNDPPLALPATSIEATDDNEPIHIDLTTKFRDIDDAGLRYEVISNSLAGLVRPSISGSNLALEVVPGAAGTTTVNVQATDAAGAQATHPIVIDVTRSNRAPRVIDPAGEIRVQEDADRQSLNLDAIFSDPDGDLLQYTVTNSNTTLVSHRLVDAALDLLFAAGQSGSAVIGITASDPGGMQTQTDLRIVVEAKDEPPVTIPPVTDDTEDNDPVTDSTDILTDESADDLTDESTDNPTDDSVVSEPLVSDPLGPPGAGDPPDPVDPKPARRLSLRFFLAR